MKTQTLLKNELSAIFPFSKDNEWELAFKFKNAFEKEDFLVCEQIKMEVTFRIKAKTISEELMSGFRYYNRHTKQYEGPANVSRFNGLFGEYFTSKGIPIC